MCKLREGTVRNFNCSSLSVLISYCYSSYGTLVEVTTKMKGKLICNKTDLLHRAIFHIPAPRTSSLNRLVFSFADAKAVNLQLAQRKADADALEAYVAERTKFLEADRIVVIIFFFQSNML